MVDKKVAAVAQGLLKKGVPETKVRTFLMKFNSLYETEQFFLQMQTKQSFLSVRWPVFFILSYVWAALFYAALQAVTVYTEIKVQQQVVNLATFAGVLFVLSVLFRPKPQGLSLRRMYTLFELAFPGTLLALAIFLFQHPGWQAPDLPDGGAFASTLWPFLWLGAWLGPQVLALASVVLAHYALLKLRTSYFINRQNLLLEQRKKALQQHYQQQLAVAEFVPAEQIKLVAQRVVNILLSDTSWNPKSTIELYALEQVVHVQPLGGGGALLTLSSLLAAGKNLPPIKSCEMTALPFVAYQAEPFL